MSIAEKRWATLNFVMRKTRYQTKTQMKKASWILFGFLATFVGMYPIIYFIIDRRFGLLSSKSVELLSDNLWNIAFYGHITLGGLALLIGWLQFSPKIRRINPDRHRTIGKIYVISVLISGTCGVYIGMYATGGLICQIGFISSAIFWLTTTIIGFKSIMDHNIEKHRNFMLYSYAVCFSAVTLRIWLPLLEIVTGDFIYAYRIIAYISWIPNIIVAYYFITVRKTVPTTRLS